MSTTMLGAAPAYIENGASVATAITKMIVNPASKIERAISLGVFCRLAPSTSAIMRSRNDSPAFEETTAMIRSESTRVPPVTEERSPPASRTTGADSPVIADSSTDAAPCTISASAGMISPASTTILSPLRKLAATTRSSTPGAVKRRA